MSLITLVIVLVIVGFALYLIQHYIPLDPPIKLIIQVIIVIVLVLWLLQIFGITGPTIGHVGR